MDNTIPKTSSTTLRRSQIRLADYNPRTITPQGKKYLRNSLVRFGVLGGIVVNVRSSTLVGGHQKVTILDEMHGYDPSDPSTDYMLEVSVVDVDLKTEKELNITLNNPKVGGYWDPEKMQRLIPEIDFESVGLSDEDFRLMGINVSDENSINSIREVADKPMDLPWEQEENECDKPKESKSQAKGGPKINKAWGNGTEHEEPRCTLTEKIEVTKSNGRIYFHSFKTGKEGMPLDQCKVKENVGLFADAALDIIKGLFGDRLSEWTLVCGPKRRHPVWNFGEEVCKAISEKGGVKFIPNMFAVASRDRFNPGLMRLKARPDNRKVILYDDIITTGLTMKAMEEQLKDCDIIRIVGINNK